MRKTIVIAVLMIVTDRAFADDPATAPVLPDKWGYTFLNPAPPDQLRAQDADRPNKTNTPHTIDAGHVQIESGIFDFDFDRHSIKDTAISLAEENVRVGIFNGVELNAAVSLFNSVPVFNAAGVDRHNGVGDLYLGGKFNFWGNDTNDNPWTTALSIQPQFKIPTASHDVGNGHFGATLGFPFLMNLPYDFHLGLETSVMDERNLRDTASVLGWQNSISVDRVFFSRYDCYLEYAGAVSTENHTKAEQTIDVGVIITLTNSTALDTGVNFGLNNASPDYEWVAGITVRF